MNCCSINDCCDCSSSMPFAFGDGPSTLVVADDDDDGLCSLRRRRCADENEIDSRSSKVSCREDWKVFISDIDI